MLGCFAAQQWTERPTLHADGIGMPAHSGKVGAISIDSTSASTLALALKRPGHLIIKGTRVRQS